MKKFFTLFFFTSMLATTGLKAQIVYSSIASGPWGTMTTWETFSSYTKAIAATPGTGTPATTVPSGTHDVLIRTGNTVTFEAAHGCKSLIIQKGGALLEGAATALRLQIGNGGTGFTYPLVDTIQVDGALGSPTDGLYIETGKQCQTVNVSGTGTIDIQRIRLAGGVAGTGILNFNINANVNLWQAANYALTAVYKPVATDNYTLTIGTGATVAVKQADGYFHNNDAATTYGTYKYVVNGTLDLSANTQTLNNLSLNIIAPPAATSLISLAVDGGLLKLGGGIKADTTAASNGVISISAINSGVVDATLTSYFKINNTTDGLGGSRPLFIGLDATGTVKETVGSTLSKYPIGVVTSTTENPASIVNIGVSSITTVGLQTTFTNPAPAQTIPRQWNISAASIGSNDTLRLGWTTADEIGSGFTHAGAIYIIHWNGTAWDYTQASVTGTGTNVDPYIAKAGGFTSFSPYAVTSNTPTPVTFSGINAIAANGAVKVSWTVAQEINTKQYVVERSSNGSSFATVGTVTATGASKYVFTDVSPINGNGFYRVKSVDFNGHTDYTNIVSVGAGSSAQGVVIASNPVQGKRLNLQLNNLSKGTYTVTVYNSASQKVYSTQVAHGGGNSSQTLALPASVGAGIYHVHVSNASASFNKSIVVE